MNDTQTLLLSMCQLFSAIVCSVLFRYFSTYLGPRRLISYAYPLMWMLCLYWILLPADSSFIWMFPPFIIAGSMTVFYSTTLGNYFLITIPVQLQIGGTFLVFVITGGIVGVIATCLNPTLLAIAGHFASSALPMYKFYFTIALFLLIPGIFSTFILPATAKSNQ